MQCPQIQGFLRQVGKAISDVLGQEIKVSLVLIIFGILSEDRANNKLSNAQASLLFVLILLARRETGFPPIRQSF